MTAKEVFRSKNNSFRCIVVLSVSLKDDEGGDLIDLESDPWKSLPGITTKPQKEDYVEEILRRYTIEDLANRIGRVPKPKGWDKSKLLKWLHEYPITNSDEVKYVTTAVSIRRMAAAQIAASRAAVKGVEDNIGGAWYGPLPMLRLIMALVDSDEMRRAYMSRNNISNARIVMDNQKSTKKRATTVWELLATKWNSPDFAPETEVVEDLHTDFSNPIYIPHRLVSKLTPATPDKVQEKFSTMNVHLIRIIRNWERSGQGDGGIDVDNEGDEVSKHGGLNNRSRGALGTRSGFLGTNQPYLLYLWEMLNKYQLLSTSFNELDKNVSSKNGGNGVPSVINNNRIDDNDDCFDFDGTGDSDTLSSTNVSSRKGRKGKLSSKKSSVTTPIRDFSGSMDRLAESNIVASKMDMSSTLGTNILMLEAEYRALDMALVDDPPQRKKTKIEEQMSAVESKIQKLKSDMNDLIATPPRNNHRKSPATDIDGGV
jgi:hypothetical protein